jgi:hypothetical protein
VRTLFVAYYVAEFFFLVFSAIQDKLNNASIWGDLLKAPSKIKKPFGALNMETLYVNMLGALLSEWPR